jgi:hypothetical protein
MTRLPASYRENGWRSEVCGITRTRSPAGRQR